MITCFMYMSFWSREHVMTLLLPGNITLVLVKLTLYDKTVIYSIYAKLNL